LLYTLLDQADAGFCLAMKVLLWAMKVLLWAMKDLL
jgi:hypothetical protein